MIITTPAHRAHERLLGLLPVRTHVHQAPPKRAPVYRPSSGLPRPSKKETFARLAKIRALEKSGLTGREIADELGISDATVSRHRRGLLKALK